MIDDVRRAEAGFICFEGIDGAGKSSLARALVDTLEATGRPVVLLDKHALVSDDRLVGWETAALARALWRYPLDGDIAQLGNHYWLALLSAWFHLVDRGHVRPLLAAGNIVIADGWYHKYAARFRLKPDLCPATVDAAFAGLRQPDRVILLDADPALALCRRGVTKPSESGAADGYAGPPDAAFIAYQTRVRAELCRIQSPVWTTIDCTDEPVEATLNRVLSALSMLAPVPTVRARLPMAAR